MTLFGCDKEDDEEASPTKLYSFFFFSFMLSFSLIALILLLFLPAGFLFDSLILTLYIT